MANSVFEIVEAKLYGQNYDEEQIREAISDAEVAIRNYCGRWQEDGESFELLPRGLWHTWAQIAIAVLRNNKTIATDGGASMEAGAVKSIKEGDTTVEFSTGVTSASTTTRQIIDDYAGDLILYRRLYPAIREA